jgi:hypothetical protein
MQTDHAIAEGVSRRLSTAEARVQLQFVPCDVCSGQSVTEVGFLQVLCLSLPILKPPTAPHTAVYRGLYSRLYSDWSANRTQLRSTECRIV